MFRKLAQFLYPGVLVEPPNEAPGSQAESIQPRVRRRGCTVLFGEDVRGNGAIE